MGTADALTVATEAVDPKALARVKLIERRQHLRRLRRTVVAIAAALFVALWGVIFVTLASGHDPVLTANAKKATVTTSSSGTSSATGSSSTSSGSSTTSSGTSSSGTSTAGTTSVTTRSS
jgi:cytoskeletal protein RodZ